jgi:hypothetical protein
MTAARPSDARGRSFVTMRAKVFAMRRAALITTLAALVAGCGSTTKTGDGTPKKSSGARATDRSKQSMPSSALPTTCTAYLHGQDALIQFASKALNVAPACQSWIRTNAKKGTLWTERPPTYGVPFDDSQVCLLTGASGAVTASVLDDRGQISGKGACDELIAAGWVEQLSTNTETLGGNSRPTRRAPKLIVGHWAGVEPSQIDYSADGGNIVTGLLWSSWTRTNAVGQGTSDIQSCVPNCAQGAENPVTTTITLLDPEDGHFTEMTENRNGLTTDWSDTPRDWPGYAS